jgi:hypothetical protein
LEHIKKEVRKMAHIYTPGLKVTARIRIKKQRKLSIKGEVVVEIGNKVNADTVVACTKLSGNVVPLNIIGNLGVPPGDVERYLKKHPGDSLKQGDIIAQTNGWFKTTVVSPIEGKFESFSMITGGAILRYPPVPVEITAYINGEVTEIFEKEGVVIETMGALVQGIFGIGGETNGELIKAVEKPSDILTPDIITPEFKDKILIGGSLITCDTLKKAVECGCKGIIVGGIVSKDLNDFLGYNIGIVITGSEQKGITLIVTEGFGQMEMAKRTFDLLCANSGKKASINGATQIRAGVLRPEVIIPSDENLIDIAEQAEIKGAKDGSKIRIIREPNFGKIGKIISLPSESRIIETGAKVRVFEIQLENGDKVTLPRANVEIIEE